MAKTLNKTEDAAVGFCLDESGSMGSCLKPTIDGFNQWLKEVRKQKGKTTITLTQFSESYGEDNFRVAFAAADAADVKKLSTTSYRPRGNTPLFDAIGATITRLQKELDKQKKHPPAAVVVIQTDGFENASRDYTRDTIRKLIEKKEKDGWTFVFLGADMTEKEVMLSAQSIGLAGGVSYVAGATGALGAQGAFAATGDMLREVKHRRGMSGQTTPSASASATVQSSYTQRVEDDEKKKSKPAAKKK